MRSVIKRGLALAAIAAACCATGLLAPAAAAADSAPRYFLESVSDPELVLTSLPYGPARLFPRGDEPGQVWELAPADSGGVDLVNLVNRDSGECLTVAAPAPGVPVVGAPCRGRTGQDWRPRYDKDATVRFDFFGNCLTTDDYRRAVTGYCDADTARWRLVPAR